MIVSTIGARRARARLLALAVLALAAAPARADSNMLGVLMTTERAPDDFDQTKSTDWQLVYSHSFDNNFSLGGSAKYYDTANTDAYAWNVEGNGGYTYKLNELWSLTGVVALGGHLPSNGPDFPYYSFTGSIAVKLTDVVTWTVVVARYRNAFDTDYGYETPEVGTQFEFRLSDAHSVSLRFERDWKNGDAAYDGIEVGYRYHF